MDMPWLDPIGTMFFVAGCTEKLILAPTVLILGPIAATTATKLGLNPDAFLIAVALGAGCDFLTPIGHQCNTLVYGPGGYKFGDYWKLGLPLTVLVNSKIYDVCPELIAAFRAAGCEIAAHGRTNAERQAQLPETQERELIAEATADITRHEGRRPRGWLGPWISESDVTPDLLKEAGKEAWWASYDHDEHGFIYVRRDDDGVYDPDPVQIKAVRDSIMFFDQHMKTTPSGN